MAEERNLTEENVQLQLENERLKAKTSTTLSGVEFLTLLFMSPIILAFVVLGVIIVWKATSNPAEVAPELDIVLVAFAIFSAPVTSFVAMLGQRLMNEVKKKSPAED